MQIYKDSITDMAKRNKLSLQVPNVAIGTPIPDSEELPDEWFVKLRHQGKNLRKCVGNRETGYLFLSEKGWEANKETIEKEFKKAQRRFNSKQLI